MPRHLTPSGIHPPFARYNHGVEIAPGSRAVFVSGQVGIDADGRVPDGVEAQTALCFENIHAILAAAGMDATHIVRLNTYVVGTEHLAGFMAARDRIVADPPPASTLLVVAGLVRPEFVVEIEAVAARE